MKLVVVYHYVAHYRIKVFEALAKDEDIDLTVVLGQKTDIPIKALSKDDSFMFNHYWVNNLWIRPFLWQRNLIRFLRKTDADVVIFIGVMYYFSTIIGSIILRRRKKKVVFWGHGFIRSQMILKERLRKRFFRLADLHLVYNNRSKQLMEQNGLSTHRIGNSLAYFDEVCDLPIARRSDKLNIIGFIGRLTKVKELDKLIYVAKRLMNKGCPLSIEIIGSGEVELDLFNLAEQEGVPIKFHGSLYEKGEIAKIIRYWSCTVSPGNVGLTAIDSLSVGVPVITHGNLDAQMPEFEAVKHRLTGSFYDRNNWLESLTNEVSYWIYNYEENVPFLCRKEVLDNWIIENQISEIKNALQNKVLS